MYEDDPEVTVFCTLDPVDGFYSVEACDGCETIAKSTFVTFHDAEHEAARLSDVYNVLITYT